MKKKFLLITFFILIHTTLYAQTLVSIGGGSFKPSENYISDFDTGSMIIVSAIFQNPDKLFSYGTDIFLATSESYDNRYTSDENKIEISTSGADFLVYFDPYPKKSIQPFIGIGFGLYATGIRGELDGKEYYDDSSLSLGFAARTGIRYHIQNNFFLDLSIKYYSNQQEIIYSDKTRDEKNIGGPSFIFQIGSSF